MRKKPEPKTALEVHDGVVYVRPPVSFRELAEWMGLSKQRVKQIQAEAIAKLKLAVADDPELEERLRGVLVK